jgi:hypothetical protein
MKHDGQPVETAWPYLSALPSDLKKWKPPAKVGTLFRRKSRTNEAAFDEVWDAVESDQPTLIGMTLSGAFFRPGKNGIIDSGEPEDAAVRHAVLAVATGKRAKTRFVLVRNSWGESWGLSGHAWLSERFMVPRVKVALTVI